GSSRTTITIIDPPPPPKPSGTENPAKSPPLPTGEEIVKKYIAAVGGAGAFEKLTSRVSKGTAELGALGMKATVEIYEKLPNKSSVLIDVPNFGVFARGFDGKKAWYQDPLDGYIPFTGYLLREAEIDSDFRRPIKLNSLYRSLSVVGKIKVGEHDAY